MDSRKSGTGGKGSNQKSAKNVSQDQGLPQGLGHTTAHNGGTEHVGEVSKEGGFHGRWRTLTDLSV